MSDAGSMRVDKWLWHARFFKTRALATKLVSGGHLRVNSQHAGKPSHAIRIGDVLTFPQARRIRVVKILSLSTRRGPAPEAQQLYHDLSPPEENVPKFPSFEGKGRPTKKDRRKMPFSRGSELE